MIVWASHVKVEHRQGLIKKTPIRKSRGFLHLAHNKKRGVNLRLQNLNSLEAIG